MVAVMRLSNFSDYSLRVLMHAALRAPELVTIDEVAKAFGISRNHLVKVVHALGSNDFLATRRGIGGGFTLALPAEKISLGNVVRLTEVNETVIDCKSRKGRLCRIFPACRLKNALAEAASAFFAVLDNYSLDDLVRQPSEMKQLLRI
ncbi:MAG TPA: Rrf2 family transcriptional regulator [Verrucomicrobiae bacterium]|nr:Rrf2 family transcriptional regulator [Verrucomicrobiae bacterium]